MSSIFSNSAFWAALATTFACAGVVAALTFEKKADLAKFIREPGIRSITSGVVLVLLLGGALILSALALLALVFV